jgi:NAD(P)-dependent dehydrogenase (short-subunit alcohol dehydrogenase family)
MNRIDGKIALITGGTQGLGAAIAQLFAKAGAAGIAIVGRDQAKGDAVARGITAATGVPVLMIAADLGDIAQVMRVVAAADARFAKVDILVNAAGLTDRGNLLPTPRPTGFGMSTRATPSCEKSGTPSV